MGFDFTGFVLRAPRVAPANAQTTDEAVNGVDRDFKPLSGDYTIASPELVEVGADQYRAAVLLRPDDGQTEFLVWAANTANLSDIGGFEIRNEATATFPNSTGVVVSDNDNIFGSAGSTRVIIVDDANRNIADITSLIVRRGDTGDEFELVGNGTWNTVSGVFQITDEQTLIDLGGGVSTGRGDRTTTIKYTLLAPSFWWTKNDIYGNRFIWDGRLNRWRPLRGTPPHNLGPLLADADYTLSPAPRVNVEDFLPGDSTNPDAYAMVRLGTRPDASSFPVASPVGSSGFSGIKVKTDAEIEGFDFSTEPDLAGVVGQDSGELVWNPDFVEEFAGQTIFYSYRRFVETDEVEPLGELENANLNLLFLAPIPGPTDYPFIRIGTRKPLFVKFADTEADLFLLTLEEGEVGVALSTGRLKFSEKDVNKADPTNEDFDNTYLGAQVFYDGVSLTRKPVPLRKPVQLVNKAGEPTAVDGKDHSLYIPDAVPTPGPGISGVTHVPDTTGTIPNTSAVPGIRFGEGSGLIRSIEGPWDLILFTSTGQISSVNTFDDDDEIPRFRFRIPRGTAFVDLRQGAAGSEVLLGRQDLKRFDGEEMFFLQPAVQPSVYMEECRMVCRVRDEFTLIGTEILVFAVNNAQVTWDASMDPGGVETSAGGTFTPEQIATSLNSLMPSDGEVIAQNGRVIIQSTLKVNGFRYGDIEIGFGPGGTKDLSGCAALGLLPGWKVRINDPNIPDPPNLNWLPDNGVSIGVFRSPFNLDGRKSNIADVYDVARFEDAVILSSISASPVVLLDRVPLEDVAGYDENVFFQIQDGLVQFNLNNYEDVYYQFGQGIFSWVAENRERDTIEQPTNALFLGKTQIIENSLRLPGKGLRFSAFGLPFQDLILNEDYQLEVGGDSGIALLIETVGALKQIGGRGLFLEGQTLFQDTSLDVDFVSLGVKAGWQLKITQGDAQGTYIVAQDATSTNALMVQQPFTADGRTVPWELYEGVTREEQDLGIVADAQYEQFNHLPSDPWKIRVLSPLGDVPKDADSQEANRLVAVLGDALENQRTFSIRFGLGPENAPATSMVALTQTDLGTLANNVLDVPDTSSPRYTDEAFSIRVGSKTYTFANGDLIKVPTLTGSLVGDVIEILTSTGRLNFGSDVFSQFEGQKVIYVEEFLSPNLFNGFVEYQPENGELNFPSSDFMQFGGTEAYFLENMNNTGGVDVTLNPIQGSLLFTKPLREFQVVEVEYFRAENGTGNLLLEPVDPEDPDSELEPVSVTEQLPLFVRLDPATPDGSGVVERWNFNPTKRTVDTDENNEPAFYIGSTLYNIGSSPVASFEINNSAEIYQVILEVPVEDTQEALITYAVFEAFGGEQTYTVSQPPVYRPPFRIETDRTSFELESDRTGDVTVGKLLRVAQFPFYITGSTYDAATNITTVNFIPETQLEAGSRDPGSDSLSLISDIPLATDLVPEAPDGFWEPVTNSYEPINRGFQSIIFSGDLTDLAVPGHLLELGGLPFIISASEQLDGGTRTQIDITSFFPRGFAFGQDVAKISIRPVYDSLPETFLGRGAVVDTEPTELILFGETDADGNLLPGRTLRPSIDYELNTDDGSIEFLNPPQGPLLPKQSLYLRHTQQRLITPILANGFFLNPRFDADYVHVEAPSAEEDPITGEAGNGRLGKILRGSYTFSNPDSWFYRTVPLINYLGEVADDVAADLAAQLPSQGPAPITVPPVENANQGTLGLKAQARDVDDTDRAARTFLEFYNVAIVAFEQILESITGNIIGDRDGKFRFFIGRGKEVPPPGYEDAITGNLNARNLFSEVFFGYNPKATFMRRDPVVDPNEFTIAGDQLEGPFIDPDFLGDLQTLQRDFIKNDVDDVVLFARTRKRLRLFPLRLEAFGRYRSVGEPSRFSRLFPTSAEYFTLTDPGIGADLESDPVDPGVYAFRKKVRRFSIKGGDGGLKIELPKRASTFFKSIADVGNPVLGQIENIGSITVRNRLPRARIFAYSNTGFPEFDDLFIGFPSFASNPRPAVIATPLPLHELPLGEDGLPDTAQLAAQGGEIIDLTTGDPELFTPAFSVWTAPKGSNLPKVAFGNPDGTILDVVAGEPFSFEFAGISLTTTKSVFVGEIILGCIITFVDEDGNPIGPDELLLQGEESDETDGPIALQRGDTVFVTPPDADVTGGNTDEQTNEERAAQVKGNPNFRVGFDIGVDRPDGELRDITFPSFDDPSIFGLKEILGQNPPKPLRELEGEVSFRNSRTEPAPIPALTGGFTNDSGDYTLPYLYAPNTEIEQLGVVAGAFNNIFADSGVPNAVYPDEIQATDGIVAINPFGTNVPATLNTSFNTEPVATAGSYTPLSGIGDVAPFDLLLIETNQAATGLPAGSQGILSVGRTDGSANGSTLEPPRFVTPTALGDRIRYRFQTAMSYVNADANDFPAGMIVRRVGSVTQFDITQLSTALLVFNDGVPASVTGGLNNIFILGSDNVVTINLWTAATLSDPATFMQSVTIDFGAGTATGDAGAAAFGGGGVTADDNFIFVDTVAPFVTIAPNPGLVPPILPEDPGAPGDTLPLWFTIDIDLTVGGAGNAATSTTGRVEEDRVTFSEGLDLRGVLPRDEPDVDGVPVLSGLSVDFVTSKTVDDCTVNGPAEVNGGLGFTFVRKSTTYPPVGTFNSADLPGGDGRGSVRVPAFEGHSNTVIQTTDPVVFSAVPSSGFGVDQVIPIATGTGVTGVATERNFRVTSDGVTLLNVAGEGLDAIEAGDILVIRGTDDATPRAAVTAGTYLVRHAIEPNDLSQQQRSVNMRVDTLPANTGSGWCNPVFPTLVESNVGGVGTITVSSTTVADGSSAFDPAGGTLYFIAVPDSSASDYGTSNFKIDYLGLNNADNQFTVDQLSVTNFAGAPASPEDIDALPVGTLVSGFNKIDVTMDRAPEVRFPRNTVGSLIGDGVAPPPIVGFESIRITADGVPGFVQYDTTTTNLVAGAPAVNELGVFVATPISNTAFVNNENAYVYDNVPEFIQLDVSAGNTDWDAIHATAGLRALMPGDVLTTEDAGLPAFYAQAGVFLEPTFPRPVLDLNGGNERVVDASNSVGVGEVGFRDPSSFGEAATEAVSWEVRRIRRFHDVLRNVGKLLGPLRYVYQIRRGTVDVFGAAPVGSEGFNYPYVVTSFTGTNLGPFNDEFVNINPGDMFRLFDNDGVTLLEEVEIAGVESATQIWLKEPGITVLSAADVVGKPYEVYLNQPPVPHEQSNAQLFSQITDRVVFERTADFTAQSGGWVPVEANPTDQRRLRDTDTDLNFANLGIEVGDIVVIDSAGLLSGPTGIPTTGQERASRPFGDRSVPGRTTAQTGQEVPFIAGAPSEFDDNRGWYRITEILGDAVLVESDTEFSSSPGGGNVTFGVDAEYAVLPTISGSTAPFADPPGGPGVEGQLDLRPTAFAGEAGSIPNSYAGNLFSIAPFSYKIIRPNNLFSTEAIDLILLMRERTFSFLEEFDLFFREDKFGNYFVFQREDHIADLGNPLIPDEGKGVMSNELIDGVRGLVSISPFANTTDSLGVLDRRFWVNDFRLDAEFPPGSGAGTPSYATLESNVNNPSADVGDGRPVLTDRIDEILDDNDQLRQLRFAWLDFRVQREDGTIPTRNRFLRALERFDSARGRLQRLTTSITDAVGGAINPITNSISGGN